MAGKCPCRGCNEETGRTMFCHGRCEKYQNWKKEYEESKTDFRDVPDMSKLMKRHIWRKWMRR